MQASTLQLASKELRVTMANGEHLASSEVCCGLEINISCEAFRIDCYTLHLSEFNLVLGV